MELSTIIQVMTTMVSSQVASSIIMTAKQTCERYFWGPKCSLTCYNCESDCNKVDGSCQKCKSGFKNPERSCETACEKHEYGINCLGDCYKVCGADCVDNVTGRCPDQLTHAQNTDYSTLSKSANGSLSRRTVSAAGMSPALSKLWKPLFPRSAIAGFVSTLILLLTARSLRRKKPL
ncbi:uncharacterized protein LOC129923880 isoform X2 [Biomphalaria glabrata]|uniref:Uncharacterized protein LOC129923880 isoform X2 n=1 Tax=Biomphalaria glabrata TaxID=6526 RepID=A0A9W2ZCN0_BIOGL|nr:uncharacterized protein LOC129923880 isoform X2 [Biomphalaria glabrata]